LANALLRAHGPDSLGGSHPIRRVLFAPSGFVLVLVFACLGVTWSFLWMPVVHGRDAWLVGGDAWIGFPAARHVIEGKYALLYQASRGFDALPLPALLLAPVVAVGDSLHLTQTGPTPTSWWLLGPTTAVLCALLVPATGRLTLATGKTRMLWLPQTTVLVTAAIPCFLSGHFEDALAMAAFLYAAGAALEERWERSGLWFSFAIAFKEWAVLALPLLIVLVPAGRRLRVFSLSVLVPVVLLTPCLVGDFGGTVHAIVGSAVRSAVGWDYLGPVSGTFGRSAVLGAAPIVALLSRRKTVEGMLAVAAALFTARVLLEPIFTPYYVAAPLTTLVAAVIVKRRYLRWGHPVLLVLPMLWVLPLAVHTGEWWLGLVGSSAAATMPLWLGNGDGNRVQGPGPATGWALKRPQRQAEPVGDPGRRGKDTCDIGDGGNVLQLHN
jgi:hypothetical protein